MPLRHSRLRSVVQQLGSMLFAPLVLLMLVLGIAGGAFAEAAQADDDSLGATVKQLVEQLGSEHYAEREKAQGELRQMGLAAFDALRKAQSSDDIEIAMRAKYLLYSMQVRWANDDDPHAMIVFIEREIQLAFLDDAADAGEVGVVGQQLGDALLRRLDSHLETEEIP